jgi:proline iminopeptidase
MYRTFAFGRNVYEYMWGPSELAALGELKDYDRINELEKIKIPTLLLCGEFDPCRPQTVKYYQSLIANSKFSMTPNAAHMTMHDNPQEDLTAISDFLDRKKN